MCAAELVMLFGNAESPKHHNFGPLKPVFNSKLKKKTRLLEKLKYAVVLLQLVMETDISISSVNIKQQLSYHITIVR